MNGNELRTLIMAAMNGKINNSQKYHAVRIKFPKNVKLLGSSIKVEKNKKKNALTSIIYLAPQKESVRYGGANICLFASIGCTAACLGRWSGRLHMKNSYNSKAWKTLTWLYAPSVYKQLLVREIEAHEKRAIRKGMTASIRLNGTSDLAWELLIPALFPAFPHVQFYDYSKSKVRYNRFLNGKFPPNYHLTFSRSESNHNECMNIMKAGGNVAVVFENTEKACNEGYQGFSVYDGDITDFRPADPKNNFIALSVKGNIKDNTGFVIKNDSSNVIQNG